MLLVVCAVSTVAVMARRRPSKRVALTGGTVALAVVVLHFVVEGYRWQMVPALGLLLLTGSLLLWRALRAPAEGRPAKRGWVRRIVSGAARFVLLPLSFLLALFLPAAFPVFTLPEPPAWEGVGVTDLVLRFEERPETFTTDPDDRRELLARVWYPATVDGEAEPVPYFTRAEARAVTEMMRVSAPMPVFLNDHAALVPTHSYRDAPLRAEGGRLPVLVFSHGYGSYVSQNTSLMEHLASAGYVVVGITHPYEGALVFPDGRSVGPGERFVSWTKRSAERMRESFAELDRFAKTTDLEERRALFEAMRRRATDDGEGGLGVGPSWAAWTADWTSVLDTLDELDAGTRESRFEGRLDLSRLGLFGMSFGGATAAEVCQTRPGCRAAINIDGGQYIDPESTLFDAASRKPLLMIYASRYTTAPRPGPSNPGDFQAFNDYYYEPIASRGLSRDVIRARIEGTSHIHLSDASLMMRYIPGMSSGIPGERIAEILSRLSRAFFDHYVRGEASRSPLLDGPSDELPEVTYQTFGHGFDERSAPATTAPVETPAADGGVGDAAVDGGAGSATDGAVGEAADGGRAP